MKTIILGTVVALMGVSAAHANLLNNGSFESGPATNNALGFVTVGSGDPSITGWTVGGEGVDYIGSYWQASDGTHSIDLSGNNPGSISQTFATVFGQTYKVTFDLAGNPDSGPAIKTGTVQASIAVPAFAAFAAAAFDGTTFTFDTTGKSHADMGWTPESFTFVGSGGVQTLTFASTTGDAYGPALDNVTLSAVPLPASLPMFGAALLGLGALGYGLQRRKAASAV